jgi:hypothetical protein
MVVGDLDAFLGFLVRVVSPPERLYNPLQLQLQVSWVRVRLVSLLFTSSIELSKMVKKCSI